MLIRHRSPSDEQCDVAIATLAQLLLQQNKVHEAVKMFEKSAEMARTEPELINALTYESATRAQIAFITAYPSYAEKVSVKSVNRNRLLALMSAACAARPGSQHASVIRSLCVNKQFFSETKLYREGSFCSTWNERQQINFRCF